MQYLDDLIKKLKPLPWKLYGTIIAISFIAASAVSVLLAFLLVPNMTDKTMDSGVNLSNVPLDSSISSGGKVTLKKSDVDLILQRNLFNSEGKLGDMDETGGQKSNVPTNKPEKSDLPLKLLGVIYGGTPFNGMATVENTQKNRINSFIVGDFLLKDVKLLEIHRKRIIIDNNGRREFVMLEEKEVIRTERQRKKQPTTTTTDGIAPIATKPPPDNFKEEGFERKGSDVTLTTGYKDKLLGPEFTKVLQDAKAEPNLVDGVLKGFVLTRIREGSIYEKAGLQNGDVVQEINGVPLNDAAGAIRLLQSIRNETEIEMRVLRNGQPKTFSLKIL